MKLREAKFLAASIVVVSLVTTNFIIPAALEDVPPLRVTAISKPAPIEARDVPEPMRVLSPAQADARAVAMRAHADRVLAENGELPTPEEASAKTTAAKTTGDTTSGDTTSGTITCVAGC